MNVFTTMVFLAQSNPFAAMYAAFQQSGWMGRLIVMVLFIGSMWAWCIMLGKGAELKAMKRSSLRFLNAYRKTRRPLDLFRGGHAFPDSPEASIYQAAADVLARLLDARRAGLASPNADADEGLDDEDLGLVRGMAERLLAEQSLRVESKMSTLATATTAAPFLGLLGTVWGVMEAFQAMSGSGTVLLSEVAPGISGALLTTVIGLLVALPSAIGYNIQLDRVRALQVQMENFSEEFNAEVLRSYRMRSRRNS